MQSKRKVGLIVGAVLAVIIIAIIVTYNSLVAKQEKVNQQWSEVQNTYQRRLDLVPNLVNVVKGVSEFEQETLRKIAEARSKALTGLSNSNLSSENYKEQIRLQDTLAAATNRLIAVVEKYPDLKGTQAYTGLQVQLEGTERRIKVARNDFNEAVNVYNNKVRSFPANIVAGLLGFSKKNGFDADAGSNQAVEIKF